MSASGLASGHKYTMSTPTKSSPLRTEITQEMADLELEEGEKTPTQESYARLSSGSDEAPDTPTPFRPIKGQGGIVVGGVIRKSASTIDLRGHDDDDVFAPSTTASASGVAGMFNVGPSQSSKAAIDTINRTASARYRARGYNGYVPREDRGMEPNANNAQGLFSPDANVFVANLSGQLSEDQLELACHSVFDVYGPNYVKVKFDKNRHPFALVQFETVDAAQEAIRRAQRTILEGREIRIEQSKVERAVIIFKPSGEAITEEEAREALGQFGALDFVCPTSILRGRSGNLPDGIYARFAFYLDCRDALKGIFGHPSQYRIQLATGVEPVIRKTPDGSSSYKGLTPPRSTTDSKSIFVGNLPEDATKENLMVQFQQFGPIVNANIVHKTYPGDSVNVFGFVEFVTAAQASAAADVEQYIGPNKLRVEPKEYSARRASRLNAIPAATPMRTPRRISPAANVALAMHLVRNEYENAGATPAAFAPPSPAYGYGGDGFETPRHYLPPGFFSPSPPGPFYGGEPYYFGGY